VHWACACSGQRGWVLLVISFARRRNEGAAGVQAGGMALVVIVRRSRNRVGQRRGFGEVDPVDSEAWARRSFRLEAAGGIHGHGCSRSFVTGARTKAGHWSSRSMASGAMELGGRAAEGATPAGRGARRRGRVAPATGALAAGAGARGAPLLRRLGDGELGAAAWARCRRGPSEAAPWRGDGVGGGRAGLGAQSLAATMAPWGSGCEAMAKERRAPGAGCGVLCGCVCVRGGDRKQRRRGIEGGARRGRDRCAGLLPGGGGRTRA